MTTISKEEVKKLADLARIEISDEKLAKYANQFGDILNYIDVLATIESDDTPDGRVTNPYNVTRVDEPKEKNIIERARIVENFPEEHKDQLVVKKIL